MSTDRVHNHGPEEGRGTACPESVAADGSLRGACMTTNPAHTPDTTAPVEPAELDPAMVEMAARAMEPDLFRYVGNPGAEDVRTKVRAKARNALTVALGDYEAACRNLHSALARATSAEQERDRAVADRRAAYADRERLLAGIESVQKAIENNRGIDSAWDALNALLAGSGEQPGERDATPDEAHDIGYAKGYSDGYREAMAEHRPAPVVPDSPDVLGRLEGDDPPHIAHEWAALSTRERAEVFAWFTRPLAVVGQGVTAECDPWAGCPVHGDAHWREQDRRSREDAARRVASYIRRTGDATPWPEPDYYTTAEPNPAAVRPTGQEQADV